MMKDELEHKSITHKIKRDGEGVCYFFPSDLAELTLMPYPESWEELAVQQTLQPANIRLRPENQGWYQFVPCRYNEKEGIVYISEENFNQYWKKVRYKLMEYYLGKKGVRTIMNEELDSQICLDAFWTQTSEARIIDAKIVIFARLPEEERLRLMSKRSSIMDNRKILYLFNQIGGPVHDKTCELVKSISLEDFRGAEEMPEGRGFCAKCRRRLHIRLAIGPDFKNCQIYESFLQRCGVSEMELEYFVRECGGKMFMESLQVMRLKCGEDTWKVERKEDGLLVLYHNNYIRIGEDERFITDGFHEQNVFAKRLNRILRYVEDYTWKGHLEAERSAEDNNLTETAMVQEDSYVSENGVMQEECHDYGCIGDSMKKSEVWWKRLAAWLKKWFK